MQHRVGRSARRRHRRDRVLERRFRHDVARAQVLADEPHDALAGGARDAGLGRIVGRHAAAAERRDAQELRGDRHGVRGELPAAGAGARTRGRFEVAQLGIGHPPGTVRANRLEHVLNRHVVALKAARRNRSAVQHQPRHVEPGERHRRRGDGLVAPDQHDHAVEAVAARDQLDRVGDHLAADERGAHAFGAHRDAIGDRNRVELHRRAAGAADALFHVHGQIAEMKVAGTDLDPGVRHADERLLEIRIGEADRLQHRAGRSAAGARGEGVRIHVGSTGS